MIKLFKVKEKQRETQSADGKPPVKKQSSGELRLQKGNSWFDILGYNSIMNDTKLGIIHTLWQEFEGAENARTGPKCTIQSTRSRLELLKECAYFLSPFFCPLFYGHLVPSVARKIKAGTTEGMCLFPQRILLSTILWALGSIFG